MGLLPARIGSGLRGSHTLPGGQNRIGLFGRGNCQQLSKNQLASVTLCRVKFQLESGEKTLFYAVKHRMSWSIPIEGFDPKFEARGLFASELSLVTNI